MNNIYYVYAYLREDGTPYYIGKGKGNRAYDPHSCGTPENKNNIKILHSELEEDDAFEKERYYIKKYGRQDRNTGILLNKTNGGEGQTSVFVYLRRIRRQQQREFDKNKKIQDRLNKKKALIDFHNNQFKYVPASWDGTSKFQ